MNRTLKWPSLILFSVLFALNGTARAVGSELNQAESQPDKIDKVFAQWSKPDSPG